MAITSDWHQGLIEDLGAFFELDGDARAVVVSGSVADPAVAEDAWSDVDVKVVLADAAVGRYFPATEWLQGFGAIVGVERHDAALTKTLRVCLDEYRRLDVVLVPESSLAEPSFWSHGSPAGSVRDRLVAAAGSCRTSGRGPQAGSVCGCVGGRRVGDGGFILVPGRCRDRQGDAR